MIGNKTYADDLTQESFDNAFLNLDKYDDKYAFSTWLYKIAKNCTIDFIRKRRFNSLHINYGADEESSINENTLYSGTLNPEENMIQKQDELILLKYIEMMKPKYRRLIELRYIKEYAYKEISEELNIPIGTVKTQLLRAKNILAEMVLSSVKKEKNEKNTYVSHINIKRRY
jgi:RNA polymerase sigma-70 factor (ECF subfamily)